MTCGAKRRELTENLYTFDGKIDVMKTGSTPDLSFRFAKQWSETTEKLLVNKIQATCLVEVTQQRPPNSYQKAQVIKIGQTFAQV